MANNKNNNSNNENRKITLSKNTNFKFIFSSYHSLLEKNKKIV